MPLAPSDVDFGRVPWGMPSGHFGTDYAYFTIPPKQELNLYFPHNASHLQKAAEEKKLTN